MTTATRSNYRNQWHQQVRGWRNNYITLKNLGTVGLHCEYIGNEGATIPAGATVTVRMRRPVSYNKAIKYHNMLQADIDAEKVELIEE